MLFVWLLLRPLVKPLLIIVGVLAIGQAAGIPVASTLLWGLYDLVTWAFWSLWEFVLDFITERVIDRANPFSIATTLAG